MKLTGLEKALQEIFACALPGKNPKTRTTLISSKITACLKKIDAASRKRLIMQLKLTIFILLMAGLQVRATTGLGQDKITLHVKGATLEKALKDIWRVSGYGYVFQDQYKETGHLIDISVTNASLTEVLDIAFKDQPYSYAINEKIIVVKNKEENKVISGRPGDKGSAPVEGVVLNESGQPLSGASVIDKETGKMTLTNEKGEFKLPGIQSNSILTVSYVGYSSKQIPFKQGTKLEVRLLVAVNQLDQVQIIAYGTTTQRLNTGDVTTVKASDIEKQPVNNPLAVLEGRVPGMFITQGNGFSGSSYKVQIRGQNSINNGNDPLYVIDGVPYASQLLPGAGNVLGISTTVNGNAVYGNPMNFITPSDIESIDVLKDADATAIYGSRAANGVVLITTKKGKAGPSQVTMNAYTGIGKVSHFLNLMGTRDFLAVRREAFKNDNVTPTVSSAPDLLLWDTTRNTNWQKTLIGGTAHYTDAQGSVSGGTGNVQYLFGGGYHRETTVFPGSFSDQKGMVHFNLSSVSVNRKFKASLSGNFMADNDNLPGVDPTTLINSLPPDAPNPLNPDGSLNWAYTPTGASTWTSNANPDAYLTLNYKSTTDNLVSNALLSYNFFPGFEIRTSIGYTQTYVNEMQISPSTYFNPVLNASSNTVFVNNNSQSWIFEPQASYEVRLAGGKFEALAGSSFQQSNSNGQVLTGTGFSSDALLQNIQAATSISARSVTDIQYKYNALFGRIRYNWQDKYLVDLTARRDGSSRFGPNEQFHNFGAVGAAWIFSNENFIRKHIRFLSFGKLRGSYGTSGSDQIGDYQFLNLYSTNSYLPYQGINGIYPTRLFNPGLAWEENKKAEGGLELGFLKDRVIVNASYFRNRSNNQLVANPLSTVTGFASIAENLPATVQNKGWEFQLNTVNVKTKRFSWTTSFNITWVQNKLLSFPNLATNSSYANKYVIGQPLSIVKAFHSIGVNDTTGVYEFTTYKGDPVYSPNTLTDRTRLINIDPKFYGGIQNSFQYSGFSLDFFFQFVKRTGVNRLYSTPSTVQPGAKGYEQPVNVLNRWERPGDVAKFEQFSQSFSTAAYNAFNYIYQSDLAYTDASFIRLKNVSVSYELTGSSLQRMRLKGLRIYVQGQNLFTLTHHYFSLDPETQSVSSLPLLRVVTAGLKVTL